MFTRWAPQVQLFVHIFIIDSVYSLVINIRSLTQYLIEYPESDWGVFIKNVHSAYLDLKSLRGKQFKIPTWCLDDHHCVVIFKVM